MQREQEQAGDSVFHVRVRGPIACFTRPETRADGRVSYEMMTPSAARNILQAVTWKPEMEWIVLSIARLASPSWQSIRRNEVTCLAGTNPFIASEYRTQRYMLALLDVDYVITARIALTDKAQDGIGKYIDIATRRLLLGQYFQKPFLGCKEFVAADVRMLAPDQVPTPSEKGVRDLGMMFYDFNYEAEETPPLFFPANIRDGLMSVPSLSDVIRRNSEGK